MRKGLYTGAFTGHQRVYRGALILCFICASLWLNIAYGQNKQIDSLLSLIKKDKEDTNKVKHLIQLGWQLSNSNPDTSIIIGSRALQLAEKLVASPDKAIAKAGKKGIANCLGNLGVYHYLKTDYPKALNYFFKALKMAEELGDKNGIARHLSNIGNVYNSQADYPKALDYYFKTLRMAQELGNKNGMATLLGNIGIIYYYQADYPKALDYYLKALKMKEEIGDKEGITFNLVNIGNIFSDQADYPKALDYFFRALKMAEELGNKNTFSAILGNIGNIYNAHGSYPKASPTERKQSFGRALDYYFKALKIKEELGNKSEIANTLSNIGALYTKTGDFAEAEKYLKHSLALYDSIGGLDGTRDLHKSLSQLYDTTGKVKLAFAHYKKYIAARDSLNSEENQENQARTEINHEFEKKEALAKAEQGKKDLIAEEEKEKQKLFLWFTICGLAVVVVVSGFIFRSLQINKKKNKIISEQKSLVEHQKKVVEEKQKEILDSIRYAKRIQTALLTNEKYIHKNLNKLK